MNAYEVLGVSPTATEEEVRRAYRDKARDLHPDQGGDEERMKELNVARDILVDPEKRMKHDIENGLASNPNPFPVFEVPFGDAFFGPGGFFSIDIGNIMNTMFNRGQPEKSIDITTRVTVPLDVMLKGGETEVRYQRAGKCEKCNGTGSKDGVIVSCGNCNGTGIVTITEGVSGGRMTYMRPCSVCNGTGKAPSEPCSECNGKGTVPESRTVSVRFPARSEDVFGYRIDDGGDWSPRLLKYGNLHVGFDVLPVDGFSLTGLSVRDVIIEGTVMVRLGDIVDGKAKVDLPAGEATITVIDKDQSLKNTIDVNVGGWEHRLNVKYVMDDKRS